MIWWISGFLIVGLGIWWAKRWFDAQAAENERRAENRAASSSLNLPPVRSSQQNHSNGGRGSRNKAYAYLYCEQDKSFTPVSREHLEGVLQETRTNLVKWRRLAKRADKVPESWKPNPKLRAEIEVELPAVTEAAKSVEKLLDQLSFESESSQERYFKLWDDLVSLQCDLEDGLKNLAEAELEPGDDDS